MKLIGNKTREYKGKKYFKYWIVIPQKLIESLNWKKGEDLKANVKNGKLTVRKK